MRGITKAIVCAAAGVITITSHAAPAAEPFQFDWGLQIGIGTFEDDFGSEVAADATGVYITGTTRGSLGGANPGIGTQDAFLLRYDRNGNLVWRRQLGDVNSDSANDVFASAAGGAYIVGSTGSNLGGANAGGTDFYIARYDAARARLWTKQIGTSLNDAANSVAEDSFGSVFVGGSTFGSLAATNQGINRTDAILSRFDQSGNLIWTRQWGQPESDSANAVVPDNQGGVFVTGSTRTSSAAGSDAFVRRFDRDGNLLWEKILATSGIDSGRGIASDGSGGIFVGGQTSETLAGSNQTPGTNDPFLARYDSSGNRLWIRRINTPGQDFAYSVSSDGNGGAFLVGELIQSLPGETSRGLGDVFVTHYNAADELLWSDQFGSDKNDTGVGISADGLGGLYVSGHTWGSMFGHTGGEPYDAFLVRYDSFNPGRCPRAFGAADGTRGATVDDQKAQSAQAFVVNEWNRC